MPLSIIVKLRPRSPVTSGQPYPLYMSLKTFKVTLASLYILVNGNFRLTIILRPFLTYLSFLLGSRLNL